MAGLCGGMSVTIEQWPFPMPVVMFGSGWRKCGDGWCRSPVPTISTASVRWAAETKTQKVCVKGCPVWL